MKQWIVKGSCLVCGSLHTEETDNPDEWLNGWCGNPTTGKGIVWCICGNQIHGVRFTEKFINSGGK